MLSRNVHSHAYGHSAGAVPPFHGCNIVHAQHAQQLVQRGGLAGGAVVLQMGYGGWAGTGYGWLGMDPSDPQTWPRPFAPAPGMISRPIVQVEYKVSGLR